MGLEYIDDIIIFDTISENVTWDTDFILKWTVQKQE